MEHARLAACFASQSATQSLTYRRLPHASIAASKPRMDRATPRSKTVMAHRGRPLSSPPPPESRVLYDPAEAFSPVAIADATLLPPVEPSKIVCVGRNYRDHAAELGNEVPAEPLLFFKPPSSLLAPGAAIRLAAQSSRVDFEGELAIVIGRQARALKADTDLRPYIRGYTIVNDVTARDLQKKDGQWTRAKGFDTFCPCGPIRLQRNQSRRRRLRRNETQRRAQTVRLHA